MSADPSDLTVTVEVELPPDEEDRIEEVDELPVPDVVGGAGSVIKAVLKGAWNVLKPDGGSGEQPDN